MAIKNGDKAPVFNLTDSDKNPVSLESFKGKHVVLLFFPAAFTGVCTKELGMCRDEFAFYNKLNAQVLAISVDTPYTLAKFKELNNYNFPLLSDFNKEVATEYGVIYPVWNFGMRGIAKRSAFVIDKDGMIQHSEILENASDLPDFNAIKDALKSIN